MKEFTHYPAIFRSVTLTKEESHKIKTVYLYLIGMQDFIITPIYIAIFTLIAYFLRPYVTNRQTLRYLLPALLARFAGAIALELIYQFYYDGEYLFNFFTDGSEWSSKLLPVTLEKKLHLRIKF